MRVLGINGSARSYGNTALIMGVVFAELEKEGIQTELVSLADDPPRPCRACGACATLGRCTHTGDGFAAVFHKMLEADGILLGSPVYSADVSAAMKAFLERAGMIAATHPGMLRHKVGAAVAAVRRAGGMATVGVMQQFLLNKEVFLVGSTYWNMVYGREIGAVLHDEEGLRNMRNLGQNMAWLLARTGRR